MKSLDEDKCHIAFIQETRIASCENPLEKRRQYRNCQSATLPKTNLIVLFQPYYTDKKTTMKNFS